MFCDRCGTRLSDPANLCPTCGKAAGVTPLMPVNSRIAGHVRLLGILWLALSAFHVIPGLILLSLFGHGMWFQPLAVPAFVHGILTIVGWTLLAGSILGLVTGWGLLLREPWARTLAIVMACLTVAWPARRNAARCSRAAPRDLSTAKRRLVIEAQTHNDAGSTPWITSSAPAWICSRPFAGTTWRALSPSGPTGDTRRKNGRGSSQESWRLFQSCRRPDSLKTAPHPPCRLQLTCAIV